MAIERSELRSTIWPQEILSLPQVEIPIAGALGFTLQNDEKQILFMMFPEGVSVPDHNHASQRGFVVAGEMTLEVEGQTEYFLPGDSYVIPAGTTHRTYFSKDTFIVDMGDAPDRYPVVR